MTYFIKESSKELYDGANPSMNLFPQMRSNVLSICRSPNPLRFYIFTPKYLFVLNPSELAFEYCHPRQSPLNNSYYLCRKNSSSVILNNTIYLIGGIIENTFQRLCQRSELSELKWNQCSPLNIPRSSSSIIAHEESIYIFGGWSCFNILTSIERFKNEVWVVLSFSLPCEIWNIGLIECSHRRILLIGGDKNGGKCSEIYSLLIDSGEFVCIDRLEQPCKVSSYNIYYNEGVLCLFGENKMITKEISITGFEEKIPFILLKHYVRISLL